MLKIKKIRPMSNRIVTTTRKYAIDELMEGDIITKTDGTMKEYQEVIAVGPYVKEIKVGDIVMINPARYAVRKHQEGSLKDNIITDNPVTRYNFNLVEMNDNVYLLLYDSDVDYIIEDSEEITKKKDSGIIIPGGNIIV